MFRTIVNILIKDFKISSVFFLIFLMVVGSIFEIFSIGVIIPLISAFSAENLNDIFFFKYIDVIFEISSKGDLISVLGKIILVFFLIKFIFLNLLTLKLNKFIANVNKTTSSNLLKIYLKKNYEWLTNDNRSNIIHIVFTEVNNFCGNALSGFLFLGTELFNLIGIIIILFFFNTKIFVAVILMGLIFFPIIYFITKKYSYRMGNTRQTLELKLIKVVNENLKGIKEFLIYKRSAFLNKSFYDLKDKLTRISFLHESLQDCTRYTIEFIGIIFLLSIIMMTGSNGFSNNEDTLLILGVYAVAFVRIMPSLNRMSTQLQRLRFGISSGEKILDYYENQSKDTLAKINDTSFSDSIEFKNVSFKFKDQVNFLFENVNLKIKKNETIGIIGESGGGKTTISNMIMGLLEPTEGNIFIDNNDAILNKLSLQSKIGFVSQNFFALDDSVFNNITLSEKKIKISNLKFALKNSLIYDAIKNKQLNLKQNIGDFGLKVSGGQLQRINIARALYRRPEILILDEPTSALDNKNQILLNEIILKLKNKMTIIIISHDKDLINNCDQKYEVVNKKVIKLDL